MVDGDDCPSGISDGTFAPTLTDVTLLSFNVTVGGVLFEMTDDDTFPDFPVVFFDVGTPIEIDFRTDSNIIPSLVIVPSNDSVEFVDAAGELSEGVVRSIQQQPVPEPVTMMLFGLGAAGVVIRHRRRPRGAPRFASNRTEVRGAWCVVLGA